MKDPDGSKVICIAQSGDVRDVIKLIVENKIRFMKESMVLRKVLAIGKNSKLENIL